MAERDARQEIRDRYPTDPAIRWLLEEWTRLVNENVSLTSENERLRLMLRQYEDDEGTDDRS